MGSTFYEKARWEKLRPQMPYQRVQAILGKPLYSIGGSHGAVWMYQNKPSLEITTYKTPPSTQTTTIYAGNIAVSKTENKGTETYQRLEIKGSFSASVIFSVRPMITAAPYRPILLMDSTITPEWSTYARQVPAKIQPQEDWPKWMYQMKWQTLRINMTEKALLAAMGDPTKKDVKYFVDGLEHPFVSLTGGQKPQTVFKYGNGQYCGLVGLSGGNVVSWIEPFWPAIYDEVIKQDKKEGQSVEAKEAEKS